MISYGFNLIENYLGSWGTAFLATMLFVAMFRIGYAFVLKFFRMDLSYKTTINKLDTYSKHEKLKK